MNKNHLNLKCITGKQISPDENMNDFTALFAFVYNYQKRNSI